MRLADLKLNPDNPRNISEEKLDKLAESIKSFPKMMVKRPIVYDENKVIIGGNMRYRAIQKLGMSEIPDEWTSDASDFTPEERHRFIMQDNAEMGVTDWDMVANQYELEDLDAWGIDVPYADVEPEVEEDEAPEVSSEPPVSQLGSIYQLGRHRVMCGDSTKLEDVERLMDGKKADMVFTDPPYGIAFEDTKGNTIKNDALNDEKLAEFNSLWQTSADVASKGDCFLLAWQSPRKFHLLDYFGSWKFFRLITMYKSNRISYPHGAWINKTEPCCVFQKGEPRITKQEYMDDCYVYNHDKESHEDSNVGHPTPKPVKMVMSNIKACAKKDDIVLDLFLGSGSTLIAAEKTGRICYGMELDPKYVDVIRKRYWKFVNGDESGWEDNTKAVD